MLNNKKSNYNFDILNKNTDSYIKELNKYIQKYRFKLHIPLAFWLNRANFI